MSYNNTTPRVEYTASIGQTIFTFLFKIYRTSDIKVYQTLEGNEPNDATDILLLTTDYTVIIDGDNGGSVTLNTVTTSADAITLMRQLPTERDVDYQTNGDLLADTLNADQDYQTYLIADIDAQGERVVTIPASSQNVSTSLPDVVPDAYLKWNSAGDALENDNTISQAALDAQTYAYGDPVGVGTTTKGAQQYAEDAQAYDPDNFIVKAGDTMAGDLSSLDSSTILSSVGSTAWDGTTLTEQQTKDFFGVGSITLQGTFVSAKSFPDGSILGSTDSGNFEIYANGVLRCGKFDGTSKSVVALGAVYGTGVLTFTYPVIFISAPRADANVHGVNTASSWGGKALGAITENEEVIVLGFSWHANADMKLGYTAIGKWK